jgi:DNA-directed RNA polymerase subunit RPC12/RpoP
MVVYICENCKKEFNKKSNYLNHIENKKKPCTQLKLKMHQNAPKCTEKATKCTGENDNFTIFNEQKEHNEINKGYICIFCKASSPLKRFNIVMHY